ncbi:MAG: DEAD/DEAH box helicase [Bacteroidetes bacterium]|nr:MAG: DEAD/DEAH box helicase [Bacteroidota bacterium]
MTFQQIGLVEPLLRALADQSYTSPTPIQAQAIPLLLRGQDILGCAQTGTGKTASFALPILQHLYKEKGSGRRKQKPRIKALVLAPTRELAIQIERSFQAYGKYTGLYSTVIFGGVKQGKQVQVLQRGVDILVATPGRLLDLIGQGFVSLEQIEYFVLDEADHMLDMGFIHDIRKVLAKLPHGRQSLFFSATMPPAIRELADQILFEPASVHIEPKQATAERVEQGVYFVAKSDKIKLLQHLVKQEDMHSLLVFSRTKHGADKIVRKLKKVNVASAAIHGNKSQNARQKALQAFKRGDLNILIATDIAARGIDVDGLSHVINYDLPNVSETYVHRIGRTGRADASGIALSFCDVEERAYLRDIQKLIGQKVDVITDHPYVEEGPAVELAPTARPQRQAGGNRRRRGGGGNRSGRRQHNRRRGRSA